MHSTGASASKLTDQPVAYFVPPSLDNNVTHKKIAAN